MDIYIYCIDNDIFNKFKLLKNKYKIHHINSYPIVNINGLFCENIFFRCPRLTHIYCNLISNNLINPNPIFAIIINPEDQNIKYDVETLITSNFHDDNFKNDLGNKYYELFYNYRNNDDYLKEKVKNMKENKFNIFKHYNELVNSRIPFPNIKLNVNEIDSFLLSYEKIINSHKYNNPIQIEKWVNMNNNYFNKYTEKKKIYFTCREINYGFGDFIQRFERLYKILSYSSIEFIPIKNKNLSYKNYAHGNGEYLTMYDFPGFNNLEKRDEITINDCIQMDGMNILELLLYKKKFFDNFPNNKILLINLSAFVINEKNRMFIKNLFNHNNPRGSHIKMSYFQPNWELSINSNNKLAVIHFRRDDYINDLFRNPKCRHMSSFRFLIKSLEKHLKEKNFNEKEIDVVILSDHYNINKMQEKHKKYIPILFDYDQYNIGDSVHINNIKFNIIDKVLGTSGDSNYKSMKYFALSDYHVGNASCFPVLIRQIFKNTKNYTIRLDGMHEIKCVYDLDILLKKNIHLKMF